MKYEKTAEDIKIEETDLKTNRTLKHLRHVNFYKFSIGDVLIREEKWGTNDWRVKTASCGLPYKYVYVFENELGVGYIRRLSVKGDKFVDTSVCVVNFDPHETRFSLDPSYANHLLLASEDDELDLKSEYTDIKKKREAMHRKNMKLAEKITNFAEGLEFLKKMKVGDTFWWGWGIRSIRETPVTITNIIIKLDGKQPEYECCIEYTSSPGSSYTQRLTIDSMIRGKVFLTKPLFMEEVL